MADKKQINKRILIETIIAIIAYLFVIVIFLKSYAESPKIAIGQIAIVILAALILNLTLCIKGFFEYFRTFIAIFAFVPMVPFSYISDMLQGKMPDSIPLDQVAIMFFVEMLPLIATTLILMVAVHFYLGRPIASRINLMCLLRAIVPLTVAFERTASAFTPILRQVFGVSMVMTLMFNYKELREDYPDNRWLSYVPFIVLFIRVIYLFLNKSYY